MDHYHLEGLLEEKQVGGFCYLKVKKQSSDRTKGRITHQKGKLRQVTVPFEEYQDLFVPHEFTRPQKKKRETGAHGITPSQNNVADLSERDGFVSKKKLNRTDEDINTTTKQNASTNSHDNIYEATPVPNDSAESIPVPSHTQVQMSLLIQKAFAREISRRRSLQPHTIQTVETICTRVCKEAEAICPTTVSSSSQPTHQKTLPNPRNQQLERQLTTLTNLITRYQDELDKHSQINKLITSNKETTHALIALVNPAAQAESPTKQSPGPIPADSHPPNELGNSVFMQTSVQVATLLSTQVDSLQRDTAQFDRVHTQTSMLLDKAHRRLHTDTFGSLSQSDNTKSIIRSVLLKNPSS